MGIATYNKCVNGHPHVVIIGPINETRALAEGYLKQGGAHWYETYDWPLDNAQVEIRLPRARHSDGDLL